MADTYAQPLGAVQGMPSSMELPPDPPLNKEMLREEWVAALGWQAGVVYYGDRVLPRWFDEITRDLREDIYWVMMLDSQVKACVWRLILGILNGGVQILPYSGFGEVSDAQWNKENEIANFCYDQLVNMETPLLTHVLPDMLQAILVGNRIAEVTYWDPTDDAAPAIAKKKNVIRGIKPKGYRAISFVVDQYMNVEGFTNTGTIITDSFGPRKFKKIPKEKFMWMSWKPINSDPRGTSDGRAAYDPWWRKMQFIADWLTYVSRFASPSLVGELPENAQVRPRIDPATGEVMIDSSGKPMLTDPAKDMLNSLIVFRNGVAMVIANGSKVIPIEMRGTGEIFDKALDRCDGEIKRAITLQGMSPSPTTEGPQAGSIQQDMQGLAIAYGKIAVANMIRSQLLAYNVRLNYGPDANVPWVSLMGVEPQDFARNAEAMARLHGSGFIDPSQYPECDVMLGLSKRRLKPEEVQAMRDKLILGPAPGPGGTNPSDPGQGQGQGNKGTKPPVRKPASRTSGDNGPRDTNLLSPP